MDRGRYWKKERADSRWSWIPDTPDAISAAAQG